jgi:hypothetical protein
MFGSSPSRGSEHMQRMYLLSVAAASRSIDLSASYFVPDALTRQALVRAMQATSNSASTGHSRPRRPPPSRPTSRSRTG